MTKSDYYEVKNVMKKIVRFFPFTSIKGHFSQICQFYFILLSIRHEKGILAAKIIIEGKKLQNASLIIPIHAKETFFKSCTETHLSLEAKDSKKF